MLNFLIDADNQPSRMASEMLHVVESMTGVHRSEFLFYVYGNGCGTHVKNWVDALSELNIDPQSITYSVVPSIQDAADMHLILTAGWIAGRVSADEKGVPSSPLRILLVTRDDLLIRAASLLNQLNSLGTKFLVTIVCASSNVVALPKFQEGCAVLVIGSHSSKDALVKESLDDVIKPKIYRKDVSKKALQFVRQYYEQRGTSFAKWKKGKKLNHAYWRSALTEFASQNHFDLDDLEAHLIGSGFQYSYQVSGTDERRYVVHQFD